MMKNLNKEEIEELLTIIPRNYPSMDIFHLTKSCDIFTEVLDDFCTKEGYLYELMLTDIDNCQSEKAHKFDFDKNRYNRHSRLYDFIFITIELEYIENINSFYKKLYPISKNGGTVIFIVDKNRDLREFEERLIKENYVAVNPITDTFKNYKILCAQKMHGWGN
jgi:hypothetical protein